MTIEQAKKLEVGDLYRPDNHIKSSAYRIIAIKSNGVINQHVYIQADGTVIPNGHSQLLKYDNEEFWAQRTRIGSNKVGLI